MDSRKALGEPVPGRQVVNAVPSGNHDTNAEWPLVSSGSQHILEKFDEFR